ncbi:BRD4-interacting chromatin-remodeling complex-associated protein-like [Daphnia carinata]|uniref:BRD4-interacting chromatin-remodeling complex-associated protein-like n=1 Tax=Daphnia carinata TaxID=120202 RepID=UPI00257E8CC0|nr:BRD4-interacting chromatin-remodeling complex-associated protein-like [Daphnia carinata]
MNFKKRIAAVVFVTAMFTATVYCQQQKQSPLSSGVRQQRPTAAPTVPPAAAIKKDGPNFDQQRLTALFGSQAQPVYGKRDPTTGQVVLEAAPNNPAPTGNRPANRFTSPAVEAKEEVQPVDATQDAIDRKDTRVPETNEINPFELLPPQFHDLLNIPLHDYGNGTTYNPYDKFKSPLKNKYPLVSTGYANTKYQGSPSTTTVKPTKSAVQPVKPSVGQAQSGYDYDYDVEDYAPIKTTRRPSSKPKTTTTTIRTTTEDQRYQDQYSNRPTTKKQRVRPSVDVPKDPESFDYRPKYQAETTRKPLVRPQVYDDIPYSSVGTSTHRPEKRPENRPYRPETNQEYVPDNRPDSRPRPSEFSYEETSHQPASDDWPPRQEEFKPYKPNRPPVFDGFSPYKPDSRPKPAKEEKAPTQPPSRPNYSVVAGLDNNDREPIFTPHQSYRPHSDDHIAEIKVTPKPFFAADENQNFGQQQQPQITVGQVDDVPDIIYDYDDERSKGEGVMFMFDNGPSGVASGPDLSSTSGVTQKPAAPVTQSPVASPYPTVASRDPRPPQVFSPAFRPSAPVRPSSDSSFLPPLPSNQRLPDSWNSFPQQKQQAGNDSPRPPFRFPTDHQQNAKENQPPNILPLFRPNTNPTNEFQFIKHPQQVEFNRPQTPLLQPGPQPNLRPNGQASPSREQRPGTINPLPSALQSPFSSISQAVANFFGRRSGHSTGNQRSGNLDATEKMDRSGIAEPTDTEADLDTAESNSGSFVLFSRPDQPLVPSPISVDRSGLSLQLPQQQLPPNLGATPAATHPQVVGIRASPEDGASKPPAFYVYTTHELEQGKPPYLVVGPVLSGPPNVAGAQLVHSVPATPINTPGSQRRSDVLNDAPNRPNSLSFPTSNQEETLAPRQPEIAPVRKPFFPISSASNNKERPNRLPTGLSPPRQNPPPHRRPPPGFLFPEIPLETDSVPPQGISPVSQGIPPPRVPLNPHKDVASLFSNPTLLHSRPSEEAVFPVNQQPKVPSEQAVAVKNPDASVGVASVLSVPLYETTVTSTVKPPKRKTTKLPSRTTTSPAYMESFNNQQPVTYATIQQEDGKKIAVVNPAYIVTYKSQPGPPELLDLDAPFVPSVESPSEVGEMSSIPFEKWHALPQEIERKGEESPEEISQRGVVDSSQIGHQSSGSDQLKYYGGFLPLIPHAQE